jgi:hypothetical protein
MTNEANSMNNYVTLVEVLELTRSLEEFTAAAQAAVLRLETEGIRELVSIQFYVNPETTEAGAVITFSDYNCVIEHMNLIQGWEEFRLFAGMVKLRDMRVYGKLSAEAEAWIRAFGSPSKRFEHYVSGFVRSIEPRSSQANS